MNEIEKKFYDALMDILSNGEISVDGEKCKVKYNKHYDYFALTFDSDSGYCVRGNKKFLFGIKPHPKDEAFSGYIPDFAIYSGVCFHGGYVVEIDGHEWHEKTKEQARIDKEKDRAYLRSGYIPVRFTGYEVFHNARRCAQELLEIFKANTCFFDYDSLDFCLSYHMDSEKKLQKKVKGLCFGAETEEAFSVKNGKLKIAENISA